MYEVLSGLGRVLACIGCCLPVLLFLRLKTAIADELFRKLLHGVLLGILQVWVLVFDSWQAAVAACVLLVVPVYPVLWALERVEGFSAFVNERRLGEFRTSLVDVFAMFALVTAVCWGIFGDRYLVMASIYAWGIGDGAAALIGKRYGRHKLLGKKSREGTAAMFCCSFLSVLTVLLLRGGMGFWSCALASAGTAAAAAALELVTPNGHDTVTCPLGAMAVLLALAGLLGGL